MMRQFSLAGATLHGVEARLVMVEVSIGSGIPGMSIVGMPDAAVQEARERVKAAIRTCGFQMPPEKIVVNLAPADLKKSGSGFDLPIALGILAASGQVDPAPFAKALVVGELSLEGRVREVNGLLACELLAKQSKRDLLCSVDARGAMPIPGLEIHAVRTLNDFRNAEFLRPNFDQGTVAAEELDFAQVGGQELAKRALQIAATGMHGVLMVGPPGSGKTMLASRLPSIMPALSDEECLQVAQIYSAAGEDIASIVAGKRPFRHPHHSISSAGLLGGGKPVKPGEVSLAHRGVCFLDEIAEFSKSTLQGLRQPIEDGKISIVRADGAYVFPARFMLVAASNPCPCGFYGDPDKACTCSLVDVARYQARIGGPLLDRIDLQLDVWRSAFDNVVHAGQGLNSDKLREGVLIGREYQNWRIAHMKDAHQANAPCGRAEDMLVLNRVSRQAEETLKASAEALFMSGRAIVRTIRVARTIADMNESELVEEEHVGEALGFRLRGSSR